MSKDVFDCPFTMETGTSLRCLGETGVQLPSPPAFARNEVESEVCRAVDLAKAGVSLLQRVCCELRLGKPARKNGEVHLRLHLAE